MVHGSQIQTKERYLYGRIECLMQPGYGSGVVSSFFTFNDKVGFQNNWAECDVEFLGRNTNQVDLNVIKTINGAKQQDVKAVLLDKRSSDAWWKVSIDWTPDKVVWKINDAVVRTLNTQLSISQKICLNIWVGGSESWAGKLSPGLLPQYSKYEYIQYSAYENGQFVFKWKDSFNTLDLNRWQVADWQLEDKTLLVKENAYIEEKKLVLKLT